VDGAATEIRVLLVDDHAIERQGVRSLLDAQPDVRVVAEAGDGLEALPMVSQCHPDVVVTETIMPRMNGLELTGQLLRRYPDLKVLVLTRNDREDCVLRLVQAGAGGYLLKTVDRSDLLAALRAVVRGGRVLQPAALECVLDDYLQRVREPSARRYAVELTPREREVLKLIAEGNTNQDIADLLCLSRKTVETHRSNIMDKLDLHKVTDLVKYAIREGLVGLD
jgi:two-component system, NarL family, response regulator NreC